MRKRLICLFLCLALCAGLGCAKSVQTDGGNTGAITLRERSKYTSGITKEAIDALNQEGAFGEDVSGEIVPYVDEQTELMQFRAGNYADLSWNANSDIGWMSYMGLIQPVDWVRDMEVFQTIPGNILENITYQGQIYAIPNRAAVTAMFVNRAALSALGWSDADIDALPGRIERGEWTLADLSTTAE